MQYVHRWRIGKRLYESNVQIPWSGVREMLIFLDSMRQSPQVLYRVHKTPPFAPVLSQINPVHTILLYLFKVHFNIVPSMPGLHIRVFLSDCPTRPCINFSSLPYALRECRRDLLLKWAVDVQGCILPCLAQGRMHCQACLDQLHDCQLHKRDFIPWNWRNTSKLVLVLANLGSLILLVIIPCP